MEMLNKADRMRSILKWGLINLIAVGLITFIIYKMFNSGANPLQEKVTNLESERNKLKGAHEALVIYNRLKDSLLTDYTSDTIMKIIPSDHDNLKSLHDVANSLAYEVGSALNDSIQMIYSIIANIEDLKSMAFKSPVATPNPQVKAKPIVDNSKINLLKRQIKNDVNTKLLREIGGLIDANSKRKDDQSINNLKGLTIIKNNLTNALQSWTR